MKSAVVVAALLASATAAAQPALTAPMAQPYYQQPSQPRPVAETKSESTATLLAIGTTVGGIALMSTGARHESGGVVLAGAAMTLIGPSVGHFYAGETGHGIKMSLLRTGAALVLGAGLVATFTSVTCDVAADPNGNNGGCSAGDDDRQTGRRMMWLGGATLAVATVYDLWDAHNAARRANVREARRYTLAPAIMTGASGARATGLVLGGQF